jgi:sterol desaturase/sphingolipid hydroxylase (fatty acid hydroxylase superfamily)
MVTEFLVAAAATLAAMVVVEYAAHRWPMHSRRFGWLFRAPFRNHAVLHHGRYYRRAFAHDPDPASEIISMRMSLAEHGAGALVAAVPLWLGGLPAAAAAVMAVVLLHAALWNAMHVEMHTPRGRWFARTRYYRYVRDMHHTHHLRPGTNFGAVFPGLVDRLCGTYAPPTPVPARA